MVVMTAMMPLQAEAQHRQASAGSSLEHRRSGSMGQNGCDVIQHSLTQLRHGIGQCRDEHIAGDAADNIEMNVPTAHAASWTGTT